MKKKELKLNLLIKYNFKKKSFASEFFRRSNCAGKNQNIIKIELKSKI